MGVGITTQVYLGRNIEITLLQWSQIHHRSDIYYPWGFTLQPHPRRPQEIRGVVACQDTQGCLLTGVSFCQHRGEGLKKDCVFQLTFISCVHGVKSDPDHLEGQSVVRGIFPSLQTSLSGLFLWSEPSGTIKV